MYLEGALRVELLTECAHLVQPLPHKGRLGARTGVHPVANACALVG